MSENMDNRIRESIESIEPREGARERMLANIRSKAEAQVKPQEKTVKTKMIPINKILKWALPIAACAAIVIIGVKLLPNGSTASENDGSVVEIANPFEPVESASVFAEKLGIELDAPDGASNVEYTLVDGNMANIDFEYSGHFYTLRASGQSGDFSGLNGIDAGTEQIDSASNAVLTAIRSGDEIYRKIEWTDGEINYVLINTDGADAGQMREIYGKISVCSV